MKQKAQTLVGLGIFKACGTHPLTVGNSIQFGVYDVD